MYQTWIIPHTPPAEVPDGHLSEDRANRLFESAHDRQLQNVKLGREGKSVGDLRLVKTTAKRFDDECLYAMTLGMLAILGQFNAHAPGPLSGEKRRLEVTDVTSDEAKVVLRVVISLRSLSGYMVR